MTIQHSKWLQESIKLPWRVPISSLNFLLTSTCWRNDHNGFSHQGPGLIDTVLSRKGAVARIYSAFACGGYRTIEGETHDAGTGGLVKHRVCGL